MRRNTPAVTKVEECTRADTGVGAAIAAGNHLENGIWALFVIAAREIAITWSHRVSRSHMWVMVQCPWLMVRAMAIKIITSPIRLVRAVIIPAPSDLGF